MIAVQQERLTLTLGLYVVLGTRGCMGVVDQFDGRFEEAQAALWAHPEVRRVLETLDPKKVVAFLDDILFSPLSISPELRKLGEALRVEQEARP